LEEKYILYIYVSDEQTIERVKNKFCKCLKKEVTKMSVINTYDINAKANMISEDLKKMDSEDNEESCILYKEMQLMAMNNMQRFKLGLKK